MGAVPTGFPVMNGPQAKGDVVFNEALAWAMAASGHKVLDFQLNTPPGDPSNGDLHVIGDSPTGAWADNANDLALYIQGWRYITPRDGMRFWLDDEKILIEYRAGAWCAPERHYKTSEWWTGRYGTTGNKIYRKAIDIGALAAATTEQTVAHSIAGLAGGRPILTGMLIFKSGDYRTGQQLWNGSNYLHTRADGTNFYYRCTLTSPETYSGLVVLEYEK